MNRERKIVQVSVLGILTNLGLVAFKAAVGFISGSIAIVMDAVNNLSDVLSSVITIIGTKLASKAPDKDHPYGHGRIEYLTSIGIASLIVVAGIIAFVESFQKILNPTPASYSTATMLILVFAVLVKFLLGTYVRKKGEEYDSEALKGSGVDALMDAVVSLSTIFAAVISMVWGISLEGYFGALISLLIVRSGVSILSSSASNLIGKRADPTLAKALKKTIVEHDQVNGAYDLALHEYGHGRVIGSVHIEVDDDMTAKEIDHLTRHLAEDAYKDYGVILTVGIYASNEDNEFKLMKEDLLLEASKYPEIKQVHGFYGDSERKLVSFDLVFDFSCPDPTKIENEILLEMVRKYPGYTFSPVLDNDFSD